MKKLSIKLRITLWYALIMSIVCAVVFAAMTSITGKMLENDIRSRIIRAVDDMSHRLERAEKHGNGRENQPPPHKPDEEQHELTADEPKKTPEEIPAPEFYSRGVHMAVYDSAGECIAGNALFDIENSPEFAENTLNIVSENGNKYYIYTRRITGMDGGAYWIRGTVSVNDESFALDSSIRMNALMTIVLVVIAAAGGYFVVKKTLKPVDRIRGAADEIGISNDLSRRIGMSGGNDEFTRLAESFDKMLDRIEQTLEREKRFTSDASHELRTPIAAILSACEYMTDYASDEEEIKSSAQSVKNEAERMSKLVSQLLTISRMDNDALKPECEDVDLSELLNFVCDEQEEVNSDRNISMTRDIEDNVKAIADKFMLARLYTNLISNAYCYGKDGGSVRVALRSEGKNAVLRIVDDGVGISEENLPKIWERFYQVDSARSEKGGAGLGLSMVKQIAERHGGSVTADSIIDEGSVFTFIMPLG